MKYFLHLAADRYNVPDFLFTLKKTHVLCVSSNSQSESIIRPLACMPESLHTQWMWQGQNEEH